MFRLTILNAQNEPMHAGATLVLVCGQTVLGKSIISEAGVATFDTIVEGSEQLAVRWDVEPVPTLQNPAT